MIILASIILVSYLVYAFIKTRSIPECLSDTAYTTGKGVFASALIGMSICLWHPMMTITDDQWQFLVFLAFTGIIMLTTSPYKDSKFNYRLHYIGTCISLTAILSLWVIKGVWIVPTVVMLMGLVFRFTSSKWLLWVELMMLISTIVYPIG